MESVEVKKRGRGRPRKRKRNEEESEDKKLVASALIKQALDSRWKPLVGRYVLKEFDGGIFLGKIVYFDTGLYRVDYEDGDNEDLESGDLLEMVLGDGDFDDELVFRREKLDEFVLQMSEERKAEAEKEVVDSKNEVDKVEPSVLSELGGGLTIENDGLHDEDASSSDSLEHVQYGGLGMEVETPVVPPPQFPLSSGSIRVLDEYVSLLFSVYTFLRSFNIRLFLSPFTLDDLVGAVNCPVQNTLSDSIHVALMRALRCRLEALSSDGSELASKCLRSVDWRLLDSITWPVHLLHYFTIMGYAKGAEWKGFYDHLWKREYYSLPVGRKLMILQILCDDALDSAELRAEVDNCEESVVGIDPDVVTATLPDNEPRRVHPRYSKASACKDRVAMNITADSQGSKSFSNSKYLGSKGTERDDNLSDADVDGNRDECRLCGMDGILLCCDGCPSSYHSRCIGVVKMYIPEGPWYCPECTINKLGPTITMETSLRGAEVFGIDLYEQVFLGTCNHLLVLKASTSGEPCFRYYNQMDIPKVLQALSQSLQHRLIYSKICKAIVQHWNIPQSASLLLEMTERGFDIASLKEDAIFSTPSLPSCKESHKVPDNVEADNAVSLNGSNTDILAGSHLDTLLDARVQAGPQYIMSDGDMLRTANCHLMSMKPHEQIKLESTESVNQLADPSNATRLSLVNRSSAIELTTCSSANSAGSHIENENSSCVPAFMFSQSKEGNHPGFERVEMNSTNSSSYVGTFFKPHAYINHYMHGDFSASAAANLSVLSSEESHSENHKSGNGRKAFSDILLQVKAFSTAASHYFGPSSERKLVEVPRERCGWCHSCKQPSSNRRGCMLNSAALTATKGVLKMISGLRPIMNGEGSLSSISTYILCMGEILCGLTVGHFLSAIYRKRWRKQLEDASSFNTIKQPLLELEENIRLIALSGDWIKAMDDWLVESSVYQNSASIIRTTQRRGVNGKRHRKHSGMTDVTTDVCHDKSFVWWRGGKLLKLLSNKTILPQSMVKKAARQGGSGKISGIHYTDDSEIPNRSRRLVWRAAVERSKNASQLALQVRYLDYHVRWSDLVRPEQNLQDGKGSETEASFFRNAVICDKKIEEKKIRYGIAFGNQKHLPSRIMKNIIETEKTEDRKDKYWFSEVHVPLYLIKEFEEGIGKVIPPSSKKPSNELSMLQRGQLRASRRDIFFYLACKREKLDWCSCASCQRDVLIRDTVTCSSCQGYCHQDCTVSSRIYTNKEAQFSVTCKRCCSARAVLYNEKNIESLISPLPLQVQERHIVVTVTEGTRIKVHNQPLVSVRARERCSEVKQVTSASSKATETKSRTHDSCSEVKQSTSSSSKTTKTESRSRNWGIVWRKKNSEDTGIDFRHKNILLRGSPNGIWLMPVCNLCRKDYNCELMYIHCKTCSNWFHAEAVEVEESKLGDVIGFKCCRCRRIKSPNCPYRFDHGYEKPEIMKPQKKASEQGIEADSGTVVQSKDFEPTTPMCHVENMFVQDDDPHLFSLSRVEQITEQNPGVDLECNIAGQGLQKLPVRRQGKRQGDAEDISGTNICQADSSMFLETNNAINCEGEIFSVEWDVSSNGLEGEMMFDYEDVNHEDMEFEPQTYFSFKELLASDDGGQLDGFDFTENGSGNCENQFHAVSEDEFPKQHSMGTSCDASLHSAPNSMACKICSNLVPSPDLSCDICGLVLHSHCSPWVEYSPVEGSWEGGSWKCGNCREWR